ncbi:ketosynthase [Steroidobacter cummioxidans]|uniref:ketosynthase n=1 Tax=Steroidobacter cummioxidans TaxID=1803913 RepID=UPI0012906597|nr:ketosynthase [Steroidobacter cummioxidans]
MTSIGRALLVLAYPLVAHFGVIQNSVTLIAIALGLLIVLPMVPALGRGSVVAWVLLLPVVAGLWWLSRSAHATLPLYIAPVLVPGFMAGVFGSTLLAGQVPLIEQLIRIMEPGPDGAQAPEPEVLEYARQLTRAWTVFFVTLSLTNLVLGLLAEPDGMLLAAGIRPPLTVPELWWSLFANMIGYLLVAAFFLIEYAYRRHRFPRQPYRNMLDFFVKVLAAMPRLVSNAAGPRR